MHLSSRSARTARRLTLAAIAGVVAFGSAVPAAQADLRVGKNQRLSADSSPFRGKDQVGLAVNPANPRHVVATNVNFLDEHCEASASFDGGETWTAAFPLQPPTGPAIGDPFMPTCRVSNHAGESMFQGVTFGSGANVYATSITPRAPGGVEQGATALVYKSTNGGVTWSPGVVALPGGTGGTIATGPYYELPSVLVQPGAGTGGADIVYSVARDASGSGNNAPPCPSLTTRCDPVRIARSLDGGQTFGPPVQVSPPGVRTIDAPSATIDAAGNLSVTWRTVGATGEIQFVRSTDQGQTWSAPVTVTTVTNMARAGNSHVTPLASSASSFPRMAVDRQNGHLYIVYNQGPPGPTAPAGGYQGADHFIPPDSHVYFQRSRDNGATWSQPRLINDTTVHPGTQIVQTRHPEVAVAPNGRVDIVWEDRRHWYQGPGERTCVHTHLFCDDARLGDIYYAYSTNGGSTFSADRRITDHSHNNDVGYDYRFATYWAFGPAAVAMGNDQLLVGWMDSREGSFDTDNQDFYLAKVDHAASGAVPQTRIDEPDAVALSVALSQATYRGGGEGLLNSTFATRNGTKVVIVNEGDVAGALAGSVLARANLGPVLLSPAGGLPDSVKEEVARLRPAGAYVVGNSAQLSDQVVADLAAAGVASADIDRVSGGGAFGTAAEIAARFDRRSDAEKTALVPAFDAAVIANPSSPDAVAAAGLAAARRLPILYVERDSVPTATANALASLNIDRTLVIGGAAQVSNTVAATLPSAKRLGGADQYATSQAVLAESMVRGLPSNVVYVASGERPMDAALLGFAVGRSTGLMALSPDSVSQTAQGTANAAGVANVDRFVVVEPTPPPAGGGTPPATVPPATVPPAITPPAITPPARPGTTPQAVACGRPRLVRRNASRSRTRADMRVRLACAGSLTARATTRISVRGRVRTVRQTTRVRRLSGLNRSIQVSLSKAAARQLRRTGRMRVRVRMTFTPNVVSATSRRSTRVINVTLRVSRRGR